jgi:hypothetical protein
MRLPRPIEKGNQKLFAGWLQANGCKVYRRNVSLVRAIYKGKSRAFKCGEPGQSDLYGWLPHPRRGVHFECEVKRPGERPTPAQIDWLQQTNDSGAVGFWADDIRYLEKIFKYVMACYDVVVTSAGDVELFPGEAPR